MFILKKRESWKRKTRIYTLIKARFMKNKTRGEGDLSQLGSLALTYQIAFQKLGVQALF
jgi:hypothetical protein